MFIGQEKLHLDLCQQCQKVIFCDCSPSLSCLFEEGKKINISDILLHFIDILMPRIFL